MKKNKLYTVNKWNKGGLMRGKPEPFPTENLFSGNQAHSSQMVSGIGNMNQSNFFSHQGGGVYGNGANYDIKLADISGNADIAPSMQLDQKSISDTINSFKVDGNKASTEGIASGNFGKTALGMVSAIPEDEIKIGDRVWKRGAWDMLDPGYNAGFTKFDDGTTGHYETKAGNVFSDLGVKVTKVGTSMGSSAGGYVALAGAALKNIGNIINNGWGMAYNDEAIGKLNANAQRARAVGHEMGKLDSNKDLLEASSYMTGSLGYTPKTVVKGGVFKKEEAREEGERIIGNELAAVGYQKHALQTTADDIDEQNDSAVMRRFSAYGGPLGNPDGVVINVGGGNGNTGALGIMQQDKMLGAIDRRTDALAQKNNSMGLDTASKPQNMGMTRGFANGGLKAAFMDEFGSDPIGAAVRYNRGLEALAAQEEAKEMEAQAEVARLASWKQEMADLVASNNALAAQLKAMPAENYLGLAGMPTGDPGIGTAADTIEPPAISSPSIATQDRSSGNSNWDYIERELRKSGKFNDIQIEGIKYNLQRESSIDPTAVGDGGAAFGLGQWHGKRQPKDRSLKGQTQHLIDTLSNFDGKEHWIGRGNYEGFMNARTPEEAHYYIAKGYERPHESIVKKVKRYSDMSLSKLKAFGGELGTNGTDWTNGLLYVDEGGSHESNPLDGVPMGLDPEGVPNLVEEGETVYNDYVFSDRLKVPEFMYKELGLGGALKKHHAKDKGISFADASKKLAQESEQRPNDPISIAGLNASLSRLAEVQEAERMRQQAKEYGGLEGYACGGRLGKKFGGPGSNPQRLTYPIFDTPWGLGLEGTPDIYYDGFRDQQNEAWFKYYPVDRYYGPEEGVPYDNRQETDKTQEKSAAVASPTTKAKNAAVKKAVQPVVTRSSNHDFGPTVEEKPFVVPTMEEMREKYPGIALPAEEEVRAQPRTPWEQYAGQPAGKPASTVVTKPKDEDEGEVGYKPYATWMRYAPVAGLGAMTLTDMFGLTNKPDYRMAERLEAAAQVAGKAPNVEFKPIGDYLRYNPMDIWYEQNRLNAIARAADRTIVNSSLPMGTKLATLLAQNYNDQVASGNLYRQALEYDDAKREKVADFNRRTNMFNSQMGLEAAMANARYAQQARQLGLSGLAQAAALREDIDKRTSAAKSANLSNFLTSLGNIGRENFAMNQINDDDAYAYGVSSNGTTPHKRSARKKRGSRWS